MDGDGPCQPQGILLKGALHLGHDFLGLRIEHIFGVLPLLHLHLYLLGLTGANHPQAVGRRIGDTPDTSVEIALFARVVVADKHHLGTHLECQFQMGGIGIFGEVAFYRCPIADSRGLQPLQFLLIVAVGHIVMGGQADIALLRLGAEQGQIATVEFGQVVGSGLALTHMVENADKSGVLLAIDFL